MFVNDNLNKLMQEDNCHTYVYNKTCLKQSLKIDNTKILMTNGTLMKVERIDLYLGIIGLKDQFLVFLRVAVLDRFYCILTPIFSLPGC